MPRKNTWLGFCLKSSQPFARASFKSANVILRTAGKTEGGGPVIDGGFLRGLYLFNPKQQEVVVDYFRNLVGSPYFKLDPNNQARYMKPTTPDNTEWAFPYELRLDLRSPVKLP